MKLSLPVAVLGAALVSSTAFAADLPARKVAPAPVLAPPVFTWTGLYVGLQAGMVWDRVSLANNNAWMFAGAFPVATTAVWYGYNSGAATQSGFVGGGHIGGNYQMGSFVVGVEGDLEGASVRAGSLRASLRGRLGFALDRALIYATGGVAFGARNGTNTYGAWGYNWGGNTSSSRTGWTVGGGVEYAFAGNWSAGLEYRYSNYGTNNNTGAWGYNLGGNVNLTENAVRARVSYHFFSAPSAPVVAKY
jgi:outer membrane immunogenic protein